MYTEHFWGIFRGPDEILAFAEGALSSAPQVYSVLDWYMIDQGTAFYRAINRADNPEPGAPPIDFPSFQIVMFAGDGKWSAEEDVWGMAESKAWGQRCPDAAKAHDPDPASKLTRLDWGTLDWARPASGHAVEPSWMGRRDVCTVRCLREMVAGERMPRPPKSA